MTFIAGHGRAVALFVVGSLSLTTAALIQANAAVVLGQANRTAVTTTALTANAPEYGLSVGQQGVGGAIQGTTGAGGGTAGGFVATVGTGVVGVTLGPGANGIYANNGSALTGGGAALKADGGKNSGVVASSQDRAAIVARVNGGWPAIVAIAGSGTAIRARGKGNGELDDCVALPCAGVSAVGPIGVAGATDSGQGVALYGRDRSAGAAGFAIVGEGDAYVEGGLTLGGGCVGCSPLAIAWNGSTMQLRQGAPVRLRALTAARDGSTLLVVEPAATGDAIVGVVDRSVRFVRIPGRAATGGKWQAGATTVPASSGMRIALSGLFTMEDALENLSAGDRLVPGAEPGTWERAPDGMTADARYLGVRTDGKGVLLIGPN